MSCPGVQSPCSDSASSPLYPSKPVSFFTKTSKHFPSNKQKKKMVRASAETIFVTKIFFSLTAYV